MVEKLKSTALILLVALMMVLFYMSLTIGLENESGSVFAFLRGIAVNEDGERVYLDDGRRPGSSILPVKIAIRGINGVYIPSGGTGINEAYKQLEPIYNEAVGSADKSTEIKKEEYLSRFLLPSVYVQYDIDVPVYLLRAWAGYPDSDSKSSVKSVLLCENEGEVELLFCDTVSKRYFRIETAASAERLRQISDLAIDSNGIYAFEDEALLAIAPDEPVILKSVEYIRYKLLKPEFAEVGEVPRQMIEAFGMNPYLAEVYEDTSYSIVYVDGYKVLKMAKGGDLVFTATGGEGIELAELPEDFPKERELASYLEQTYKILSSLWEKCAAVGRLSLDEITDISGGYMLRFEMQLDGAFVSAEYADAASVIIENGKIVQINLSPRNVEVQDKSATLPIHQAAAAIAGKRDIRPCVRYVEDEYGILQPVLSYVRYDKK